MSSLWKCLVTIVLSLAAEAMAEVSGPAGRKGVLRGEGVSVEADIVDGHLRQRYLAKVGRHDRI